MAYTDIDDPSAYFQTALYNGTGGSHSITNTGNSDLQPDWVWVKSRNAAVDHELFDSVRGAGKALISNGNYAESSGRGVNSFDSDGFSLVNAQGATNDGGRTYVGWQWKKSATAGFDIVSYTGNGSNRTISHSLSAVPKMMIIKNRTATSGDRDWSVYHQALGNGSFCLLNTTDAKDDSDGFFNATTPTSSVFTVGTNTRVNANSDTIIAYLFAEKKGFSKFGSYTGNGSASNGPFIFTGFKPAFVLCKNTGNSGAQWLMVDNKRVGINPIENYLQSNSTSAEGSDTANFDFLSNGFKCRSTNSWSNQSGYSIIYMAFSENPFTTSSGIPACAR